MSQGPIAQTLPVLAALDPAAVEAAFRAARGRTPDETLAARNRVIGPSLSVAYRRPVKIVRGWMQYLYDQAGRQYLDAYNNVPHVGHSHPRVVRAAAEQMLVLNTNTRYLHDKLAMFAERLVGDTAAAAARLLFRQFRQRGERAGAAAGARPHQAPRRHRPRRRVSRQHDDAGGHQSLQVQRTRR